MSEDISEMSDDVLPLSPCSILQFIVMTLTDMFGYHQGMQAKEVCPEAPVVHLIDQSMVISPIGQAVENALDFEWLPAIGLSDAHIFDPTVDYNLLPAVDSATGETKMIYTLKAKLKNAHDSTYSTLETVDVYKRLTCMNTVAQRMANYNSDESLDSPQSTQGLTKEMQFSLYPNPAKNELNVTCNFNTASKKQLTITNVFGQIIYKQDLRMDKNSERIDLTTIPAGTYLCDLIVNGSRLHTSKLIVIK